MLMRSIMPQQSVRPYRCYKPNSLKFNKKRERDEVLSLYKRSLGKKERTDERGQGLGYLNNGQAESFIIQENQAVE